MVIDGAGLPGVSGAHRHGERRRARCRSRPRRRRRFRTLEDAERFKRSVILRPELEAAKVLRPDAPELSRLAAAGVTTVLATPTAGLFKGQSALVNVAAPVDEPQIGAVADSARGTPGRAVAGRAARGAWQGGGRGAGYPVSLLGTIAFVQAELPRRAAPAARRAALRANEDRLSRDPPTIRHSTPSSRRWRAPCRSRSRPSCPARSCAR